MNLPGYDAWRLSGPEDDRCPDCFGSVEVECPDCIGHEPDCSTCEGTGTVECPTCCGEEPDGDYEYERRRDAVMDRG